MNRGSQRILIATVITGWAAAVALGAVSLWRYEAAAGSPANPPNQWPAGTRACRRAGLPSLVVLTHPRCPCTRATIDELAKLMTDCNGKLVATVLVLHPAGTRNGWEKTDLWSSAAAIPGVTVLSDDEGVESRRFQAATSGQALLYGADGRLLFAGGITESRGHSGDNAGRSAITALVLGGSVQLNSPAHTPVYGCPLFEGSAACTEKGNDTCRP